MSSYAVGKRAFGFCDRCGFRYPLNELKKESVNLSEVDLKVCPSCWDPDHPQNQLGRMKTSDPQALEGPRPDTSQTASRYGDSIRWDFDSDREYWMGDGFTPSWSGGEIVLTTTSRDVYLERSGNLGSNSSAVSVDSSTYKYIRVRIKRTSEWIPSISTATWSGRLYWANPGEPSFGFSKSNGISEPVWTEMGDPYHILTWDLSQDSDWTGTIDKLRIYLTKKNPVFSWTSGSYTIDYIRAEES